MITKQDLIEQFKSMDLKPTDTIFTHSSYRNIAKDIGIEGGADTVVDAFIEYFGQEGLVVFPAMSWKLGYLVNKDGAYLPPWTENLQDFYEYGTHFNVHETPSDGLGIIPEIFRKREGVVRSICPTSSVAAYGKDAKEFCSGHEKAETPLNWNSPWGKLYDRKAKILFLGTGMRCNTFMHVLEEKAGVPNILFPYIWKYTAEDYDGVVHEIAFKRHEPDHNRYYHKIETELVEKGIAQIVPFGAGTAHLVDVVKETEYMMEKFKENPVLFTHEYNKTH